MKLITLPLGLLLWAISTTGYGATFETDFSIFNGLTSTSIVEDFESIVPKDTALAAFSSNGITYTGLAGTPSPNVFVSSPGYDNYGLLSDTTSSILTANGDEDFTLDFSMPVTALGFDTYLNGFGSNETGLAVVEVFGVGGLIGTFNPNHDPTTIGFLGITSAENITSLRWTTIDGATVNTGIDNIRIGSVSAVPIPAAAFMFAPALLGFLGLRRRAKNTIA